MSLKITGTTMTSAVTPHTAMARPVSEVPDEPTLWSVTWLPGRALTRNEAVTAMTIAETLALHPDALTSADRRWRMLLEPWAHELYLSANEAAELLAAPPYLGMEEPRSTPEPPPVRANALGDPCPDWCTAEHVTQDRTVNLHISDPVGSKSPLETRVRLIQDGSHRYRHERPEVSLSKSTAVVHLNHAQSEGLADLLEALADDCTPDQLRAIAAEVRAGASLIDPLPQLSATVAEMTADREARVTISDTRPARTSAPVSRGTRCFGMALPLGVTAAPDMRFVRLVNPLLVRYGTVMSEARRAGRGSADQEFSGAFGGQDWLAGQLRDATGIDAVASEHRPDADASVMVQISKATGAQSTERLSLWWQPGGLSLGTWPAELKDQAKATYRTGRAQRIVDFAAGNPVGWQVRPNVYLAYRSAPVPQRVYLTCKLGLEEYVRGWMGEDFKFAGGHHRDRVRPYLWPWLLERGYASTADEGQLDVFLTRLGKRDAHLRPGIGLKRTWGQEETAHLGKSGELAEELRAAITEVLSVLDEPLPPACAS